VSFATSDGAWIETPQISTSKAPKEIRAKSGAPKVQNAVQNPPALTCTFSQLGTQRLAAVCEGLVARFGGKVWCEGSRLGANLQSDSMGDKGFEPSTPRV
jgi:hypothetical protein